MLVKAVKLERSDQARLFEFVDSIDRQLSAKVTKNITVAVWIAYPKHAVDGTTAWFEYRADNVVVKNPDAAIPGEMWTIAQRLWARMQEDDCEFYNAERHVAS
ncbi:hypothetical protein KZJ38_02485 [Paraburkholderia edwinii]|jgi:hypothetical protein|uniref:Uncharacterized protein n=1 Tax=Paraburkholderia edwinii TaxID=2861782 RepID=A0ABX8UL23_9BURK|nr:hypothetical protein [Paraburkholderia edwinii]QYD69271.1 hypothetical protein KZJ38_02485 [Paraburkholderia edwinii]